MNINDFKMKLLKQILETDDIAILMKALKVTEKKSAREGWEEQFKTLRKDGDENPSTD